MLSKIKSFILIIMISFLGNNATAKYEKLAYDFGQQEPGANKEIKNFCEAKFGITFPMTEKVSVKGNEAHPFYIWAKENHGKSAVPKWNFHKIIINKEGKIEKTFSSITNPSSKKFNEIIKKLIIN